MKQLGVGIEVNGVPTLFINFCTLLYGWTTINYVSYNDKYGFKKPNHRGFVFSSRWTPGLLSKAQLEALIHYAFSVNLRDKYSNINEICLKNLDSLGRNIDEMVNSVFPSNISNRDEMIESFNEYLKIEKAHGLNSVNKIEEAFSSKVHIDEDVDVEGIFSSLLISIKKSMQETNLF